MTSSSSTNGLSFTMVRARDLYPKKSTIKDDVKISHPPFNPLPGEDVLFLGYTTEGVVAALSNYRFFVSSSPRINIPLGLIEYLEQRDLFYAHIYCKDGRYYRIQFHANSWADEWCRRISSLCDPVGIKVEDTFAFAHKAWTLDGMDASPPEEDANSSGSYNKWFRSEIARLRFDVQGAWRISNANKEYKLCGTYPEELLIPFCISDVMLDKIAQFRSARRVPAILWRHSRTGAVLARCSQPEVGWLGWRSTEDEQMVKALTDACAYDKGTANGSCIVFSGSSDEDEDGIVKEKNGVETPPSAELQKKVLIIDARSYAAAFGNRARGGGVECPEYYPNTEIVFMSLANIHCIRKSFHALRNLCNTPTDQASWFGALDGTKWLSHMSGLVKAAIRCTTALENEGRPVIVHCSDGWDRTPQIVSLSQLLLDPYYRTLEGFRVLVEKEWLDFGHKMADRCGLAGCSADPNERSPIFLQWLDCVYQLLLQFPCTFEFNQSYLVKLAQHTYSSLFGTFLCNSQRERVSAGVAEKTRSVWTYLGKDPSKFVNFLYKRSEETLWPRCEVRDLSLWKDVYVSDEMQAVKMGPSEGSEVDVVSSSSDSGLVKDAVERCQLSDDGDHIKDASNDLLKKKRNSVSPLVIESSTDTLVPEDSSKKSHLSELGTPPLDSDGLVLHSDPVQSRLAEIIAHHHSQIRVLEQDLYETRLALRRVTQKQIGSENGEHSRHRRRRKSEGDEEYGYEEDEEDRAATTQSGSTTSELSWEAVDEKETKPTLWVPDHAATACMGCKTDFWFGRRKHHCRSCGLLFCSECSDHLAPIPTEQLYNPVRVCDDCFTSLDSLSLNGASEQYDEEQPKNNGNPHKNLLNSSEGVVVEQPC